MGVQLIIFDFDGTLANSMPAIESAIRLTVAELGLPEHAISEWVDMIGLPLRTQLTQLLPPDRWDDLEKAVILYRRHYAQLEPQGIPPFSGVLDLIKLLDSRLPLAIASSKKRESILKVLEYWGLQNQFQPIISPTEVTHPKPHPESIHQILNYYNVSANQTVMIGDTAYDIEMALRAGVEAWAVGWGVHSAERLQQAGAHQVFTQTQDLVTAFKNLLA